MWFFSLFKHILLSYLAYSWLSSFHFKFNLVSTNIRVVIKVHFRENFNSRFFSWYFLSLCGQLLFCVVILIHFLRQFSIELISFKITTILNEVLLLALKPAIFFFLSLFTSVKLIILILIHNLLDFFSGLNLSQFFFPSISVIHFWISSGPF